MAEVTTSKIYSPLELKGLPKYISSSLHRTIDRAVWTFAELGIADLMADCQGPITALQLSQRGGEQWNAEYLYRLLRVVSDADIVKQCHTEDTNPIETTAVSTDRRWISSDEQPQLQRPRPHSNGLASDSREGGQALAISHSIGVGTWHWL
jgi:hypothetical protein